MGKGWRWSVTREVKDPGQNRNTVRHERLNRKQSLGTRNKKSFRKVKL